MRFNSLGGAMALEGARSVGLLNEGIVVAHLVGRVGFEPTMSSRRRIMSPLPATSTASGPEYCALPRCGDCTRAAEVGGGRPGIERTPKKRRDLNCHAIPLDAGERGPRCAALAHLITHISVVKFTGVPEAGGEIHHSLQTLPDGLNSGFTVAFAPQEAAEHGDQAHDLI